MKLQSKVVVVTGSTRGIGRAVAEACAKEGARVVIASRQKTAVEETCSTLKQQGLEVTGIPVDVQNEAELERLLQHALETWGRVDVWINNAGISGPYRPLHEIGDKDIESVVATNLIAILKASRLIIPYFIANGGGILINMSGKGGRGDASPLLTTYAATKAAIVSLTKSLALENKANPISIHAIMPGMVATDFYKNVDTSPSSAASAQSIPYVLKAIGVPIDIVARLFVNVAAQEPGKSTGKIYSLFSGWRMVKGITKLMWYRAEGKISSADN